jgi:kumamolisin
MLYNSVVRAWRFTPLLTTLALLSACTEESAGGATESAGEATDGIAVSSPSSSSGVPTTTLEPPESSSSLDPSHPDGSNSDSTIGDGSSGDRTTGEVSAGTSTGGDDSSGSVGTTGGDCDSGGHLCDIPPEEQVPTEKPDGLPGPLPGVYDDQGAAPEENGVRALIGFPNRDRAVLEQQVADMYDPMHPDFHQYLDVEQWMTEHAPYEYDYALVKDWLESRDLTVTYEASNRLLIAFKGSVKDFNATFKTTLHICMRKNPQIGNPPFAVYCTLDTFTLPKFVAARTTGLIAADLPAPEGVLPMEAGSVIDQPPDSSAFGPAEIAAAYEFKGLYAAGFTGQGARLGVVGAATFHSKDLQTFWKSFKVTRALPTTVDVMEPVVTRITETILDTQWSSVMAPGADVIVYQGPDNRNTALLYAWNEAIGRGEVSVLTTSFAHREDSEPKPLRHQYDESALMGAAIGMTLISASGDSARPDTPCSSPYVTCVGGTKLTTDGSGNVLGETTWSLSGSGDAKTFAVPEWQKGTVKGSKRAMTDLAIHASPGKGYWIRRFGQWEAYGGTSFSAPVFAGMVAVINSYRQSKGLPNVGFINPALYRNAAVQATFRDIVSGGTDLYQATPGWDYPTGWGAPRALQLAEALP